MRAVLTLLVLSLVTIAAFWLVWMNRASERIVSTVIPIAVASLVGIFLAVFVFGGQQPVTAVFPSSFQYQIAEKMPAKLPWRLWNRRYTQAQFGPAALQKVHPEVLTDASDANGQRLYHHLLQKSIVDWLGTRYRQAWQIEISRFEMGTGRQETFGSVEIPPKPPAIISTTQIEELLEPNVFAKIHTGFPPQIALPPGTKLSVQVPNHTEGSLGKVVLENRFCTLTIQTQFSSWMRGVGGYAKLAGMPEEEENKLGTATYFVRVTAEFSRLRSGHPEMPKHINWAKQLVEGLQEQFDEQIIWSKTKEDYLFWNQVENLGPAK